MLLFFQPITNDIAVHAGTVNQVLDSGQTLLIALGEDEGADVKAKLDSIRTRFANINDQASTRQAQLVELLLLTQQYLHIVNEVSTRLRRAEENVAKLEDDKGHAAEVEQERIKVGIWGHAVTTPSDLIYSLQVFIYYVSHSLVSGFPNRLLPN